MKPSGQEPAPWQRHRLQHDAVALSYLDAEGDGRIVIALHAHWMVRRHLRTARCCAGAGMARDRPGSTWAWLLRPCGDLRRRNARLEILDGGHEVPMDNPAVFAEAVKKFLQPLGWPDRLACSLVLACLLSNPVCPIGRRSAGQQRSFTLDGIDEILQHGVVQVGVRRKTLVRAGINQLGAIQRR